MLIKLKIEIPMYNLNLYIFTAVMITGYFFFGYYRPRYFNFNLLYKVNNKIFLKSYIYGLKILTVFVA